MPQIRYSFKRNIKEQWRGILRVMILGHERQQKQLKQIFGRYDRGAFLLVGPEGVGKRTLIEALAREYATGERLILVKAEKSLIGKDTAEAIRSMARLVTLEPRVIIIDEAQRLTADAQNRLLKVIEEEPAKTFFFFVTDKLHRLLPTIRSRLATIRFGLVPTTTVTPWLLEQGYKEGEIRLVTEILAGRPGALQRLLDGKARLNLVSKFLAETDSFKKFLLLERIIKELEFEEALTYLMTLERRNLIKPSKTVLTKLRAILALYFESGYNLNKGLQLRNLGLQHYLSFAPANGRASD